MSNARNRSGTEGSKRLRFGLAVAVALLAGVSIGQAQGAAAQLRWRNGDVLPGRLLESTASEVRWSSPLFLDDLAVDAEVLESILFTGPSASSTEAFRVGTISGDVFAADLIGSDDHSLLFFSRRCGPVRVSRDGIYSLDRLSHPRLALDGSQSSFWGVAVSEGPIKNLAYRIYDGSEEWPRWTKGEVPEVSRLIPVADGMFAAGYLDLGLAEMTQEFAMVFAGQLETAREGDYTFELSAQDSAKLFVDGTLVGIASPPRDTKATVKLGVGPHSLRLEYGKTLESSRPALGLRWAGPGFSGQSLVGINPAAGWRRSREGHLQTDRPKASIFRGIELPDSFEIDLELTSSGTPRFVLALGGDASNLAVSPQPLRLETWDNELVLVQDTLFESVMTISENQQTVQLRLAFDGKTGALTVFDSEGRELLRLHGVTATRRRSGLFIRNRGEDLTVRRLRVYRSPTQRAEQRIDLSKPRVHLMDGQIVYGHLVSGEGGTTVVDQDGTRHNIDLAAIDRVVRPGVKLTAPTNLAELTYADGAMLRGRVEQANSAEVVLRTLFSPTPVACTLAGASSLRFASPASEGTSPDSHRDELVFASGRLRGRVSFDLPGAPFGWRPEGAAQPVRLGNLGGARVERDAKRGTLSPSFDAREFPRLLHLKNGEVIPCQVTAYDESTLGFRSPFIQERELDSTQIKAIEFKVWRSPDPEDGFSGATGNWRRETFGPGQDISFGLDPVKLDRALTVPRFNRENPPSHILVADNGDLKRGNLVALNGQTLQFESKLQRMTVPVNRMAGVVDVTSEAAEEPDEPASVVSGLEETVRATLVDGPSLVFEAMESTAGMLLGRSAIYGEIAIPIESIQRLTLGEFQVEKHTSSFVEWVVRPAREPEFSNPSPPEDPRLDSVEPIASAPAAVPPVRSRTSEANPGVIAGPSDEGSAAAGSLSGQRVPDLGLVRLDPGDRSLRFPVSINQRAGLVEYALVTDEGKTHESVFRTDAEPTHIHLGLLLLGGAPAYARQLPSDPSQPLPGEPVLIEVAWTEDGVSSVERLGAFIVTTNDAATLEPGPWVFNGSVMIGKGLAAQTDGSIISLRLDAGALINNPRPGRGDDELHRVNPRAFPADSTRLEMVVRLAKDEPHRANRELSKNPNLVNPSERHESP